MALDDEIVLEAKAARSGSGWGRVSELVLSADSENVVSAFSRRCRGADPGADVLDYTRALVSALGSAIRSGEKGAEKAADLLLRIVLKIVDIIHTGIVGGKNAEECVALLAQEIHSLPAPLLTTVSDAILKNLHNERPDDEYICLQLLPPCLSTILGAKQMVCTDEENGEEQPINGAEYVDHFVECIVAMRWSNLFLTKMASLVRELGLESAQVEKLMKKIFGCMKHLEPQDLPALVYQLLLLASKGFRQTALDGIVNFFGKLLKGSEKNDVLDQVVGTVILHINFAVRQDPPLGQELLSSVKSSSRAWSPFMVSVLLSIARMQRFEQPSLELLKSGAVGAYRNSQLCRDSKWAFTVAGEECLQRVATVRESLMKTVQSSAFGWEHVAPSIVKVGFLLIDTRSTKSSDTRRWDQLCESQTLGIAVLVAAFKVHDIARDEIIEQSKCRIIGFKAQQSYPIIRMLGKLIQGSPLLVLGYTARLKECLDYFTFLHPCSARLLVETISPLSKLSGDLQDYIILVLRKAMFNRDTAVRISALQGLLDLVRARMSSGGDSIFSESEASCSQSSQAERGSNNLKLLIELLGLFRRCLTQQAGIREALYKGLPKLLVDSAAADILSDILWPHFSQFYDAGQDNNGYLKLDLCVTLKNDAVHMEEPVDHLLYCIHQLLVLQPQKDQEEQTIYEWTSFGFTLSQREEVTHVASGKSLSVALKNLRNGMQAATLTSLCLDRLDGMQKVEQARIVLGILEVLLNAAVFELYSTDITHEKLKGQTEKEINSYVHLHESLMEKLTKKQSKAKPGADSKKPLEDPSQFAQQQNGFVVPQSLYGKRKPLLSFSTVSCLLQSALEVPKSIDVGTWRQELVRFTLNASLRLSTSALSETEFSTASDPPEDEVKAISQPLFKALLQIKSKTKEGNKEKKAKSDNEMVIGLRSMDNLIKLAERGQYVETVLRSIVDVNDLETDENGVINKFLIDRLEPLLEDLVISGRYAEVEVIAGTVLFLGSKLPGALMNKHGSWATNLCQERGVINPAAAKSLAMLAITLSNPPDDVDFAQSMANELLKVMGMDEAQPVDSSDKLPILNSITKTAVAGMLLQQVDNMMLDTEWLVGILKMQPRTMHNINRVQQEESLHRRVEGLVSVLSKFMTMNLPDALAEQVLRIAVKLYKNLASVTRLCIAPRGVKQAQPTPRFQKLAESTCKNLTRPLYNFMAMMQKDRQENLDKQAKGTAIKIKREGRTIPNLVYYIEDYEKNLIQLSKVTKVNLMRHAKRSTARDFKLIEKPMEEDQQQANDELRQDEDEDEDEAMGEDDEEGTILGRQPTEKVRRTNINTGEGSSPKRQRT